MGWTSLLLEVQTGVACSDPYSSIATPDQIIGVALTGHYVSEVFRAGRCRRGAYDPGAICIHRPTEVVRYRFPPPAPAHADFTTAMLYLPQARLSAAAEHLRRAGQRSIASFAASVARDPVVAQTTSALVRAMAEGIDDLYAESAVVHLVTRYGSPAGADHRHGGVMSDARLARVIEFMSVHFDNDFSNDTGLGEYQPLVQTVLNVLGPMMANGSAPERIAEIINSAATDETDRLRYEAGPDAVQMLAARRATDDGGFLAGMKAQFGLGEQQ